MEPWRGKWALITGASAGIGLALGAQLAAGGTNLILTARRRERLETLAERLAQQHVVRIEVFPADLTLPAAPGAPVRVYRETTHRRGPVGEQCGLWHVWTIPHVRPHTAAGDGAGQYRGGRCLDASVSAGNDPPPAWGHFNRRVGRRVSGAALPRDLCRLEGVRSTVCRGAGRRGARLWHPGVCPLPRIDRH